MLNKVSVTLGFAVVLCLAGCCSPPVNVPNYLSKIGPDQQYPLTAIVMGDTRDKIFLEVWRAGADTERKTVAEQICAERPAMVINTGDIVLWGCSQSHWAQFDQENRCVRDQGIPYFPCLGNHDYWGDNRLALDHYFSRFPDLLGRKWYDITTGKVLWLLLDSNYDELATYEIAAQERWFQERLQAAHDDSRIKLVIVVTHHPPYTNAVSHGEATWLQQSLLPLIERCPKARLFISGHNHSYEHLRVGGVHYIVSGGGGAPLMGITTDPKRQRRPDVSGLPAERGFHYCRLTLTESSLLFSLQMLQPNGSWREQERFQLDYP